MLKRLVLAACAVCALATPAFSAKKLVIASDTTWPPMEFVNDKKEITGYSVEYMKAAAQEAGYEVEIKSTAWDGIFAGLAAKKYDAVCSSVEITDKRKKTMDFSEPYYTVTQALVVGAAAPYKTLDDLKGKKIGAQIGTTGADLVKKTAGVTSKEYDEIGMAIEDLVNGRIDGVVTDDPVASYFAIKRPEYAGKVKFLGKIKGADVGDYAVAVRKGDKATLEQINKGVKAVKAKGIDKELQKKWMGE